MDEHTVLTPLKRFKTALSECKRNIVLYFGGSFYPIHKNHIRTLEFIRQQIQSSFGSELNVIGAYIVPTHQSSLKKKLQTNQLLDVKTRLEMIGLALQGSDWIDIDSFLVMQKTNIGLAQSKRLTQDYINRVLSKMECNDQVYRKSKSRVTCISILGVDNFEKIAKQIERELIIIIKNRVDFEFNLEENIAKFKLDKCRSNLLYLEDSSVKEPISSSMLREMVNSGDSRLQEFLAKEVL